MLKTTLLGCVPVENRSMVSQVSAAVPGSTHTRALPRLLALVETHETFLVFAGTLKVALRPVALACCPPRLWP